MSEPVTTFPTLDEAESALDWIGLDFTEGEAWFEGMLDEDDAERLDDAIADAETPLEVRALATALRERWRDESAPRTWRVAFPG